ncbi:MAG TPA: endo-1,4-beta-xylanase [Fimbriimonadaceae bacterium]|nr:endo-1,4-beta-xylanase [Fimbriimonadaceae bacterium]
MILILALAIGHSGPTLRDLAHRDRMNLGSCVQVGLLRDHADRGRYEEALVREMNLVEPENELKPPSLWRGLDKYDFSNPDFLLGAPGQSGWAQKHGLRVRGHVLVYARDQGYTIPRWLLDTEASTSPDRARQILHDYIFAVVGRYRGKIAMWDVVNEAIDDRPNNRPFNLRDSFWFRKLGKEFLPLAFKFAHEADPRAELYYNEYGVENGGRKAESMLALADYLKEERAPITGLGLQYHTVLPEHATPGDGHFKLIESIRDRKLAFMITELDLGIPVKPFPRDDPNHGLIASDPAELSTQADRYAAIFRMARSFKNCHGVQMWGITDRHSWISMFDNRRGAALILDGDYRPKPAYDAVRDVLAGH